MTLEIVLDTNALVDRDLMSWMRRSRARHILPAVAYAEIGVLWAARGRLERAPELLRQLKVEVEWFTQKEAERAAVTGFHVGDFAENARDHLIAAHVTAGRVLVTHNKQDFTFLQEVRTPHEIVEQRGRA